MKKLTELEFDLFVSHVNKLNKTEHGNAPAIWGLLGETGEVIDLLKKNKFQGHDLNLDKLNEDVGDVIFYLFWYFEPSLNLFNNHLAITSPVNLHELRLKSMIYVLKFLIIDVIHEYNLDIHEILKNNIDKLKKRYTRGEFNYRDSVNR